jgi:hypothetical protein
MYVDGVMVRSVARSGAINVTGGPLNIGGNVVWGGEYFQGVIDEVRIYNRALSATEIRADMNPVVLPPPTPTLSALAIAGPASVNENSSASYTATATYSDGSTKAVATTASWSENSTFASIAGGTLTASAVTGNQAVTITASYTDGGVTRNDTHAVTIVDLTVLSSLAIAGPASVDENNTARYTATATYSDGTSRTVTASWSEDSAFATISAGTLTAGAVTGNQPVRITASYTEGGVTRNDTHNVTIVDLTVLSSLAIAGPASVNENSTAPYTATASYSDGTSKAVTAAASWSEDSEFASMASPTLVAGEVSGNQAVTITASYTEGAVTRTAVHAVTIVDLTPPPPTLTSLAIAGPASVNENSTGSYTATASYSDGSSKAVTASATWSEDSAFATIAAGVLAAGEVSGNQALTVAASYSDGGITRSATLPVAIVDLTPPPPTLTSLAIAGPARVI